MSVGLNPSFSEHTKTGWGFLSTELNERLGGELKQQFFEWPGGDGEVSFDETTSADVEAEARANHPFYKASRDIYERLGIGQKQWTHLDVFAVREPSSKALSGLCIEAGSRDKLTAFGAEQYLLFWEALQLAAPRLVVVFSSTASRIYLRKRELTCKVASKAGCYFDDIAGRRVPILFSSFPKYVDTFSQERLKWHAKRLWNRTS